MARRGFLLGTPTADGQQPTALHCWQVLRSGDMKRKTAAQKKVSKVMREYKAGTLHTGKPGPGKGPVVKSRKQALAIALSQAGISVGRRKRK